MNPEDRAKFEEKLTDRKVTWDALSPDEKAAKKEKYKDMKAKFKNITPNERSATKSEIKANRHHRIILSPQITVILGNQDIIYVQYWAGGNLYATDSATALVRNLFNQKLIRLGKRLQALQNSSQSFYNLMAVDLAMGISAIKNNFRLTFTPHSVKPVRLYVGEDSSVNGQFYVRVSCRYTFR